MALFKDICYLGNLEEDTNKYGDIIKTIVYSNQHKFINVRSVGQKEFYEAKASGFKPEIKVDINVYDYNSEEYVKYNEICYKVIRTYQKGLDIIELTLERGVNNGCS